MINYSLGRYFLLYNVTILVVKFSFFGCGYKFKSQDGVPQVDKDDRIFTRDIWKNNISVLLVVVGDVKVVATKKMLGCGF